MNIYGYFSYIIIHVYIYLYIFLHKKFFTGKETARENNQSFYFLPRDRRRSQ